MYVLVCQVYEYLHPQDGFPVIVMVGCFFFFSLTVIILSFLFATMVDCDSFSPITFELSFTTILLELLNVSLFDTVVSSALSTPIHNMRSNETIAIHIKSLLMLSVITSPYIYFFVVAFNKEFYYYHFPCPFILEPYTVFIIKIPQEFITYLFILLCRQCSQKITHSYIYKQNRLLKTQATEVLHRL